MKLNIVLGLIVMALVLPLTTPAFAGEIEIAKEAVTQDLLDPDSAKFRNVNRYRGESGSLLVCGEINAKNAYGAYTGYDPFMYAVQQKEHAILPSEHMSIQEVLKICGELLD